MGWLLVAALATLLVVFGVSASSKVTGLARQRAFARSLRALRLLPVSFVVPVAVTLSCVELVIAAGLVAALFGVATDASWALSMATTALLTATALLVVLTAGIVSVLSRRSTASCACFGASERPLSWRHVLRNALMLLVGVAGAAIAVAVSPTAMDPVAAGLAGVVGVIVAVVLIRLDEIVELFAPTGPAGRMRVRS
jgi:ABC-type dipeptide/oligopeptide/nickel transport system permease component